jgi:hypothetical protein
LANYAKIEVVHTGRTRMQGKRFSLRFAARKFRQQSCRRFELLKALSHWTFLSELFQKKLDQKLFYYKIRKDFATTNFGPPFFKRRNLNPARLTVANSFQHPKRNPRRETGNSTSLPLRKYTYLPEEIPQAGWRMGNGSPN